MEKMLCRTLVAVIGVARETAEMAMFELRQGNQSDWANDAQLVFRQLLEAERLANMLNDEVM